MKKRAAANGIMVAVIAVIVLAGILTAGWLKGWFDPSEDGAAVGEISGIVSLRRGGVAYPLEKDTVLRGGDVLETAQAASAVLQVGESYLTVAQNSSLEIHDPVQARFSAELCGGELFAAARGNQSLTLCFAGQEVVLAEGAASLSVRAGAQELSVYSGTAAVGDNRAEAGQKLSWVDGERTAGACTLQSLNDFLIEQIRQANETDTLCFTDADLDGLLAQRAAEREALLQDGPEEHACSVMILCDAILDNRDALDQAKAGYVPRDGCIFSGSVGFAQGETAFDVLRRVCVASDIPLEYSWTPLYDSYYIEGINNIYEFDCGPESGWMYKINGWFPNYGCSSYQVCEGDTILFCYTCVGRGADLDAGF